MVGNKNDLEKQREISKEEAEEFATKYNLIFLETSAKDNINVDKLFEYFTYKLVKYFEQNQDQYIGGGEDLDSFKTFENLDIKADNKKKCNC